MKNLQLASWKLLVVGFVFDMYCNYSCSEFVQRQNRLSVVASLFQIRTCPLILQCGRVYGSEFEWGHVQFVLTVALKPIENASLAA